MNQQIEPLRVDFYNRDDTDVVVESTFNRGSDIISDATQYTGTVEHMRVDLQNLVLDPNPAYEILILNDEGDKAGNRFPGLPHYVNIFKVPGMINEVKDFDRFIYTTFHKSALPLDLGDIMLGETDEHFVKNITQDIYDECYATGLFKVYFNVALKAMFPEFTTTREFLYRGKTYFEMDTTPGKFRQRRDTLPSLLKATEIRVMSSLPTTKYKVYSQAQNQIVDEGILSTLSINEQVTNIINKTNTVYIPNVYRYFSFNVAAPINSFSIQVKIYYLDGTSRVLTMPPGGYFSITLRFSPKSDGVIEK